MCGRYTAANPVLMGTMCFDEFDVRWPNWPARFNIAPSQLLPAIVRRDDLLPEAREMRWGLVPFWEKSDKPKIAPINAKSEEIAAKPMFRQALQKRRSLLPADGFFEWKKLADDVKQPFYIGLRDQRPFYFAAIYEAATDTRPETVALLTTRPNSLMETIHNRMPVILTGADAQAWLKSGPLTPDALSRLTAPFPADEMRAVPVSRLVNSPRNTGPEVIAVDDLGQLSL